MYSASNTPDKFVWNITDL